MTSDAGERDSQTRAFPTRNRSFVRRGSRLEGRHARAWDAHAQEYVVPVSRPEGETTTVTATSRLDVAASFGREPGSDPRPLYVEIGAGQGETLIAAASAYPQADLVGLEVWRPGIAQAITGLVHHDLHNVRLIEADAAQALPILFAPGSVDEVWTFFPDPWPKSKHHKRRLVTADFADTVAGVLRPGGIWRLATDWAEYAEQMRDMLLAHPSFETTGEWAPRFTARPVTRFERRGRAEGRAALDLVAVRR